MIIDVILSLLLIGAIFRGRDAGLVRQLCSTAGFVGGLFAGAFLQPHVLGNADTTLSRALLSIGITLGIALLGLSVGEYLGQLAKLRVHRMVHVNKADAVLGSVAGGLTLLLAVWLVAPAAGNFPSPALRRALSQSEFVATLQRTLPSAPDLIARVGNLIDPNGFPDVFAGLEPRPSNANATLPALGDFTGVVAKAQPSVVKVLGRGCGGVVEGSGFVAADSYVITNAHVIAGVQKPTVLEGNTKYNATPVWFNPDLDVAVLRVNNLNRPFLDTNSAIAPDGTAAVALGYPGGGDFTAEPASVLDEFTATGRNIYGTTVTRRQVYEIKANIIPGNSGGPLLNKDGQVIGLVFAQSTNYDHVGYALAIKPVMQEFSQAVAQNKTVSTSSCAE